MNGAALNPVKRPAGFAVAFTLFSLALPEGTSVVRSAFAQTGVPQTGFSRPGNPPAGDAQTVNPETRNALRQGDQNEPPPLTYQLNPGDVIDLQFSYNPEMNQRVTVRPDGMVSLQLLGDVPIRRMSPSALAETLKSRYAKYFRHPDVTVTVQEFGSQRAFVGGEVTNPGVIPLRGPVTCLQAVLQTGGPKTSASLRSALLIRYRDDNVADVRKLDLQAVMKGEIPDIQLKPYDVLYVSRSRVSRIGLFVEQYINSMIPRSLVFPYNLNTSVSVQ